MAVQPIVRIDDNVIRTMLSDPKYAAAIPCIKTSATIQSKGCGRCRKRSQRAASTSYAGVRTCIATLNKAQQATLKHLLNTRRVRVTSTRGNRSVQVTY